VISWSTLPRNCKTFIITIQKSSEIMLMFAKTEWVCMSGVEPERSRPKSHVSGVDSVERWAGVEKNSGAERGEGGRRAGAERWAEITEMGFNAEHQNSPLCSNGFMDISPLCQFAPWTFRHQDVSPPGCFAPWTFHHLDDSPPRRFAIWMFRHHAMDDSPPSVVTKNWTIERF